MPVLAITAQADDPLAELATSLVALPFARLRAWQPKR
jgi:DNA-binding MurR/RpiR family transcriptional regulator